MMKSQVTYCDPFPRGIKGSKFKGLGSEKHGAMVKVAYIQSTVSR